MLANTVSTEASVFLVYEVRSSDLQKSAGSGMLNARKIFPVAELCSSTSVPGREAMRMGWGLSVGVDEFQEKPIFLVVGVGCLVGSNPDSPTNTFIVRMGARE